MLTEEQKDSSYEELTKLKADVASLLKEKKEGEKVRLAEEKEDKIKWAKETLEPGNLVTFTYKGEVIEGEVKKLNEKSFTAAFEYEGEDKVLARAFHLLVEIINEDEEA